MSDIVWKRAERKRVKLRISLCGPSGSGKTYSALKIAKGLGGKVALLDAESGRGSLYSSDFDYTVAELSAPYSPARYIEYIKSAEQGGFDVLIIDSLSHAWAAEGGVLDMVDKKSAASRGNSFTAWRDVTPEQNRLVEAIISSKMHIIITLRSKVEYVVETDQTGRTRPRKIGLAPVQREGLEFEFTVGFDLSTNGNIASTSKDNTKLFRNQDFVIDESTGQKLIEWVMSGKEVEEVPVVERPLVTHLTQLIKDAGITELNREKVLAKYNAASWEQLTDEQLTTCIGNLNKKLEAK